MRGLLHVFIVRSTRCACQFPPGDYSRRLHVIGASAEVDEVSDPGETKFLKCDVD